MSDIPVGLTIADLNVTLNISGGYNGNGQLLGTWQSDGRNVSPLSVLNSDPRTATLNSFTTRNPNGDWTLFLADVSAGQQSTLNSWGMEITAAPEAAPLIPALLVLGGAVLLHWGRARK